MFIHDFQISLLVTRLKATSAVLEPSDYEIQRDSQWILYEFTDTGNPYVDDVRVYLRLIHDARLVVLSCQLLATFEARDFTACAPPED